MTIKDQGVCNSVENNLRTGPKWSTIGRISPHQPCVSIFTDPHYDKDIVGEQFRNPQSPYPDPTSSVDSPPLLVSILHGDPPETLFLPGDPRGSDHVSPTVRRSDSVVLKPQRYL